MMSTAETTTDGPGYDSRRSLGTLGTTTDAEFLAMVINEPSAKSAHWWLR
jgi:hypothetical protein